MKKVLLIGDMVGFGKVGVSAMMPVMAAKGHYISVMPTAFISNPFNFGKIKNMSTVEYMEDTMKVWDELGFTFDYVFTGYIKTGYQANLIADFCKKQKEKGAKVFTDTIMGEDGHKYGGLSDDLFEEVKKVVDVSDCFLPSYTEVCFLLGEEYETDTPKEKMDRMLDELISMGERDIVITSCVVDGVHCCVGYDKTKKEKFLKPFDYVDVKIGGTGDLFSSTLMGDMINGKPFMDAVQNAMDLVREMIILSKDNPVGLEGIYLEKYIDKFK